MLDMNAQNVDSNGDPVPSFATDAEIEIAERLRHEIEERYLSRSGQRPPSPQRSDGC